MQNSSYEFSTPVSDSAKCKQTNAKKIRYNSRTDVGRLND